MDQISPSYQEEAREDTEEDAQQRLVSGPLLGLGPQLPSIDWLVVWFLTLGQNSDFLLGWRHVQFTVQFRFWKWCWAFTDLVLSGKCSWRPNPGETRMRMWLIRHHLWPDKMIWPARIPGWPRHHFMMENFPRGMVKQNSTGQGRFELKDILSENCLLEINCQFKLFFLAIRWSKKWITIPGFSKFTY